MDEFHSKPLKFYCAKKNACYCNINFAIIILTNHQQAPGICSGYQVGTYSITILDDEQSHQHNIILLGATNYTQEQDDEHALIVKEVKMGLNFGRNYRVEVTAESIGITRSRTEDFGNA